MIGEHTIETQFQSKSPLYGFDFESFDQKKKKKEDGDASSESENVNERLKKEKEKQKRQIHLDEMKKTNEEFVKSIFESRRVSANEVANIHCKSFLN